VSFVHDDPEFQDLLRIVARERGLAVHLVQDLLSGSETHLVGRARAGWPQVDEPLGMTAGLRGGRLTTGVSDARSCR